MVENPFTVFSPESLAAADMIETFVGDVPGVESIQSEGHTHLLGSRGSGKTMILRYLEPDCQTKARDIALEQLPFYAAYLTIRQSDLVYAEFEVISGTHIDYAINEHVLVLTIASKFINRASKKGFFAHIDRPIGDQCAEAFNKVFQRIYLNDEFLLKSDSSINDTLRNIVDRLSFEFMRAFDFFDSMVKSTFSANEFPKFSGKVFRFSSFLLPIIDAFKQIPGMPVSHRFFLMIDDADNLNLTQTKILNTWLSQRISGCSLKVASQIFDYKTYYTINQRMIEAPHDYNEINISDLYTSNRGNFYKDRIYNIINRRLQRSGVKPAFGSIVPRAENFFPEDRKQQLAIERIKRQYNKDWALSGRGARARDDAYRYSRPDYMVSLGGTRKSRHSYSYSGFDQLVNISSGNPRYFLEAAHKMFDRETAKQQGRSFTEISPENQDRVVRELADALYMKEIGKLFFSDSKQGGSSRTALHLHNFIMSLCQFFENILISKGRSERRVFSFAIQDTADSEVSAMLRMGVQNSYFSQTLIGRKEGFGRTERYVLTRRLAPAFNLDPNGFSGYQFMTNKELREMMEDPNSYRLKLRRRFESKGVHAEQATFNFVEEE